MSRAFVKEIESTAEDLPDRPIARNRNLVTPQGLAAIEEALARFERANREAIAGDDSHAAALARRRPRHYLHSFSAARVAAGANQNENGARIDREGHKVG
jgi:hypothetical protein